MTRSSRAVLTSMTRKAHNLPEEKNIRVENKKVHKAPTTVREGLHEDFFEPNQPFRLHSGDKEIAKARRGTDTVTVADTADGMTVDLDRDVMNYLTSAGKSRFRTLQDLADAMEKTLFGIDGLGHPSDTLTKFLNQWTTGGWKAMQVESVPQKAGLNESDTEGFINTFKSIISLDAPEKSNMGYLPHAGKWTKPQPIARVMNAFQDAQIFDFDLATISKGTGDDDSIRFTGGGSFSVGYNGKEFFFSFYGEDSRGAFFAGKVTEFAFSIVKKFSIKIETSKGWTLQLIFPWIMDL